MHRTDGVAFLQRSRQRVAISQRFVLSRNADLSEPFSRGLRALSLGGADFLAELYLQPAEFWPMRSLNMGPMWLL